MENTFISNELEEMRSQIGILKEKLEKQTIVNEKHIRNSIKSKASDLNRVVTITICLGIFALIYPAWFFYTQGLSLAFVIATVLMLAVCLGLTVVQKVSISRLDFSEGNLLDTAQTLSKFRTHYKEWYKIAVPLVTVWFGWLIYEMISKLGTEPYVIGFCVGAAVGGIIGGILGFRINRNIVRKAGEILEQIQELQKGE